MAIEKPPAVQNHSTEDASMHQIASLSPGGLSQGASHRVGVSETAAHVPAGVASATVSSPSSTVGPEPARKRKQKLCEDQKEAVNKITGATTGATQDC